MPAIQTRLSKASEPLERIFPSKTFIPEGDALGTVQYFYKRSIRTLASFARHTHTTFLNVIFFTTATALSFA